MDFPRLCELGTWPLTPKQELSKIFPIWVLPVTGSLPCPSRPGLDGSEQRWRGAGGLLWVASIPVLLSSQWRAELHWEDFQRGGAAGILRVREFIPLITGHGAWLY